MGDDRPPGTIPLTGPGSLIQARRGRWAESFGIALAPFIGITFARFAFSGISPSALSPVDFCFAMLSAAAVLAVQLVNEPDRKRNEVVNSLIWVVIFAIAFTATAVATVNRVEDNQNELSASARAASGTLNRAGEMLRTPLAVSPHVSDVELTQMRDRIASDSATLLRDAERVDGDSGITPQFWLALLLSVVFLGFALRVWSRL